MYFLIGVLMSITPAAKASHSRGLIAALKRCSTQNILLVVCLLGVGTPLFAQSWRISDFQDTILITEDGSALVKERINLVFIGQWHGIHRTIPVEYPGPQGTNYTLFLDVTGVTDGAGQKLKYESKTSGGFRDLKIYIPGAVDTTRTVEITYIVRNGIRYFEDHDEFYWNVTGNDWPVPIDHAEAHVYLPKKAAGTLRAQAFTGAYGSAERDATSEINGADVAFETTNPLPMRGGMTIDIFIPKGILQEPGALTRFFWFIGSNPVVFLPFVTFGVMFVLWWYKGRDPDPGRSVAPMYEPPPGMSPAEAGALIEDTVHPRDITSTIVDLAVRGYLKIEETVDTNLLIFHSKDYIFHSAQAQHGMAGTGAARTSDAGKYFRWRTADQAVQPEEPLLYRNPGHQAGHQGGAEKQRHVPARPRFGQWI